MSTQGQLNAVFGIYVNTLTKILHVQEKACSEMKVIFDECNKKRKDIGVLEPSMISTNKKIKTRKDRNKSGYNIFVSEYSKAHLEDKTRFADAGIAWKILTEGQRQQYNEAAKEANSRNDVKHDLDEHAKSQAQKILGSIHM